MDSIKYESTASADDAMTIAKLILTISIDHSMCVHNKDAARTTDLLLKLKKMFDDLGYSKIITLLRY